MHIYARTRARSVHIASILTVQIARAAVEIGGSSISSARISMQNVKGKPHRADAAGHRLHVR